MFRLNESMGKASGASDRELRLFHYRDPEEGFDGYLAIEDGGNALEAGGFRVQPGLLAEKVARP